MKICTILLLFLTSVCHAEAIFEEQGFHWYTPEPEKEEQVVTDNSQAQVSLPTPSMYEQLMQKRREAKESLATALLSPSVENTVDYMRKQQEFAKTNQQFVKNWEIALLLHPELDYKLNYPTDNNALSIRNDEQSLLIDRVIKKSSENYGFILFYKGESSLSQKFVNMLMPFVHSNGIQMISVSTDNRLIPGLPNSVHVSQEAVKAKLGLKAKYQPALFMVNLKTQKLQPLSYGFMSQTMLKKRFFDVVTNFKRFSYEGLTL